MKTAIQSCPGKQDVSNINPTTAKATSLFFLTLSCSHTPASLSAGLGTLWNAAFFQTKLKPKQSTEMLILKGFDYSTIWIWTPLGSKCGLDLSQGVSLLSVFKDLQTTCLPHSLLIEQPKHILCAPLDSTWIGNSPNTRYIYVRLIVHYPPLGVVLLCCEFAFIFHFLLTLSPFIPNKHV